MGESDNGTVLLYKGPWSLLSSPLNSTTISLLQTTRHTRSRSEIGRRDESCVSSSKRREIDGFAHSIWVSSFDLYS